MNRSKEVLDTLETFLETHPELEEEVVAFGPRILRDPPKAKVRVYIGKVLHEITVEVVTD